MERGISEGSIKCLSNTISICTNSKYDSNSRLNSIVDEMGCKNNKVNAGKIVESIKNRIKSSYDKLYQDYDKNKETILKHIQQVQMKEQTVEAVNNKIENVLKEKRHHDKLKLEVQKKQKYLKKLIEIQKNESLTNLDQDDLSNLDKKKKILNSLQEQIKIISHQCAIFTSMKDQRRQTILVLKEKHSKMLKQLNQLQAKTKKLTQQNIYKKKTIFQLQQAINKAKEIIIPIKLAKQVETNLSKFEVKYRYENIMKNQVNIQQNEIEARKLRKQSQKNNVKKMNAQRLKQQNIQYEILEQQFLIKQAEQEKIKKLCGVEDIRDILNHDLEINSGNLSTIQNQIKAQIDKITIQNQELKKEIQSYLSQQVTQQGNQTTIELQKQLQSSQTQLRRIQTYSDKKSSLLINWQAAIQLIVGKDCSQDTMVQNFSDLMAKIQFQSMKNSIMDKQEITNKNNQFSNEKQQSDSEQNSKIPTTSDNLTFSSR